MWFAGIDWADTHHDIVVIDEGAKRLATRRFAHTASGIADLIAFLKAIGDVASHPEHLACIIETTHGVLITALLEAGLPVYSVNPATLQHMRSPSRAKTDAIDAYLLARKGRNDLDTMPRLLPDKPIIAELKALTRDQDGLIQMQTRLVNQIIAALKAYYPLALTVFSKIQQQVTVAFLLRYPTLADAQAASVEELEALLRQANHPHAARKAQEIMQAAQQPQLAADPITTRTKARLLVVLLQQLQPVMDALAVYDAEIARLFVTHPDHELFDTLPGAGERLAPRLLAEWGDDRDRYPSASCVQMLSGTAPVPFQSGNFCTARQRFSCVKPLRNVLYQFAWQSTQQEAWAKTYYQRKRTAGKTHAMAVRALANQWVRIIFAAWQRRVCYDRTIFLRAQAAHLPQAA
jgi:transposase